MYDLKTKTPTVNMIPTSLLQSMQEFYVQH